eukprot:762139-Hanusia_phi.AAC.1
MPVMPAKAVTPAKRTSVSNAHSHETMEAARSLMISNKSSLVIDSAMPYKILAASESWLEMFGFDSESNVLRRSLNLLQGPGTNSVMLNAFLSSCTLKVQQHGHFQLYTSNGAPVMVTVSARRCVAHQGEALVLEFGESAAKLPLEIEMECNERPLVLVEATVPFRMSQLNEPFVKLTGLSKPQMTGRALCMVQGPNTNSQELADMIKEAAKGTEQEGKTDLYNSVGAQISSTVRLLPVAAADGSISHVLLQVVREETETLPHLLEEYTACRLRHNRAVGLELREETTHTGHCRLSTSRCQVARGCDPRRGNRCPARALYNRQTGMEIQESFRRRSIASDTSYATSMSSEETVEEQAKLDVSEQTSFFMYLVVLVSWIMSMISLCDRKHSGGARRRQNKDCAMTRQLNAWIYLDEEM